MPRRSANFSYVLRSACATAPRSFLGLVLSIVGVQQSYLATVEYLDERRLKIVLRAMVRLADHDQIAIGTRM
jgi:hypothetical protein